MKIMKGGIVMNKWTWWSTMIVIGTVIQAVGEIGKVISKNKRDEEEE